MLESHHNDVNSNHGSQTPVVIHLEDNNDRHGLTPKERAYSEIDI